MTEQVLANQTLVGQTLGQFSFKALLGVGGSSRVYRAERDKGGPLVQTVAIKILNNDLAEDPDFRKRFMEEANISASFNHPNILPILDAGELGRHLFIAMQFVDGSDLDDLIRRGALPLDRAMSILRQAAKALDAAHAHGLVHRDVKPGNFLLVLDERRGDHVYLTDFGIAKRGSAPTGLTRTGMFIGTAEYAAPEQIRNEQVDERADIYALGCVFYQCLTGIVPFDRPTEYAVLSAHLNEAVPSLSERRPDLPSGLDEVIATAMAKDKFQRYRSCGDLVAAAEAAAYPVKTAPPTKPILTTGSSPKPLTKPSLVPAGPNWWTTVWTRTAVRLAALALIVAVLGGVGTAGFILTRPAPTPSPPPTATPGTAPVISQVAATPITAGTAATATITWTTDVPSDSQVEYGISTATEPYGTLSPVDTAMVNSHSQTLLNLWTNSTYNYRVVSRDAVGHRVTSSNFRFVTAARAIALTPQAMVASLPEFPIPGYIIQSEETVTSTSFNGYRRSFTSTTANWGYVRIQVDVYGPTASAASLIPREPCNATFTSEPGKISSEVAVNGIGAGAKGCQYRFTGFLDAYEYITGTRNVLVSVLVTPRIRMDGADAMNAAISVAQRQLEIIDRLAPK
jgi:serine/threonine protein kinase